MTNEIRTCPQCRGNGVTMLEIPCTRCGGAGQLFTLTDDDIDEEDEDDADNP